MASLSNMSHFAWLEFSVFVTYRPGKCFYIVVVVFIFAVDLELGCQIRAKKRSLFGGIISIIIAPAGISPRRRNPEEALL